jgi:hypothetical protein
MATRPATTGRPEGSSMRPLGTRPGGAGSGRDTWL